MYPSSFLPSRGIIYRDFVSDVSTICYNPSTGSTNATIYPVCLLTTVHGVTSASWMGVFVLGPLFILMALLFCCQFSKCCPIHFRINGELLRRCGFGFGLGPTQTAQPSIKCPQSVAHLPLERIPPRCRSISKYSSMDMVGRRWSGPKTCACRRVRSDALAGKMVKGLNGCSGDQES